MSIIRRTDPRAMRIKLERKLEWERQQLDFAKYIDNTQRMLIEQERHRTNIKNIEKQLAELPG